MEKQRNLLFDNAKYLLIILVVIGHSLEPFINTDTLSLAIYRSIYLFHMPAFALICGYLAKNYNPATDLERIAKKVLVPYLFVESFIDVIRTYPSIRFTPLTPSWGMWFLLSYFCWYLLLPYYKKFKHPVISSVIIGLLVGYIMDIDTFLSISRTIVFMPFFMFGYLADQSFFKKDKKYWGLIFILTFALLIYINLNINYDYRWLHESLSYYHFNSVNYDWLFRGIIYLAGSIFTLLFLRTVTAKKTFFTKWGANTLYAYLSQIIFFTMLEKAKLYDYIDTAYEKIALVIVAILITTLFSTNTFKELFKKFSYQINSLIINLFNKTTLLGKQVIK